MTRRIYERKAAIDTRSVTRFFKNRVARYDQAHPYVSMLYQDANPELAAARDQYEKETLLPLLGPSGDDRVLDIGCGIGRWTEALAGMVETYHGTDITPEFLEIAAQRFSEYPGFSFQQIAAQSIKPTTLERAPPFSLLIVAGLVHYLNDDDCLATLRNCSECADERARVLIRCPIGTDRRLTLDGIWSSELQDEYSAIYRTDEEYVEYLRDTLIADGFRISHSQSLYPPDLRNRPDTHQHFYLLTR